MHKRVTAFTVDELVVVFAIGQGGGYVVVGNGPTAKDEVKVPGAAL